MSMFRKSHGATCEATRQVGFGACTHIMSDFHDKMGFIMYADVTIAVLDCEFCVS